MKKRILFSVVFALCVCPALCSGPVNLSDILKDIGLYRDRTVSMELRLKYVDRIFDKIFFYDSDNIDIEFDIADRKLKEKLKNELLNVHEGMMYTVTFRIAGTGNLGGIIAELIGFRPVLIDKIPE